MFEEYQICPYTGLRSFTEEESLYFKGREEHIDQATEQLQRNKFLMLTGASGDGKSSLVYAGIVPNARAGFLKSKYTQWKVADFRPERTPFGNLCSALAKQFDIANPGTVEAELEHGFSALVDLYKNSKCFVDIDSVEWQAADESQKAALKRSAANLIIIVDQFEEFFTNPENYHNGVPSVASNLVLNVLLETARIALEENLPIYIVFTMRSDYIGQCAAFRSLPEYIGFSQFFVPRLNRAQLQQVIEEPAVLSGNKISRRLSERLIHDIAEGVDQLPILQHALNQIWHAADSGKEEMDLIHYAMVGGIGSADLPDDQVDKFKAWFDKLPEKIKHCYREPNLQNVLDAHANKLFESAAETYRIRTGKVIADEMAKEIIKKAFICLTKIDQSRAVRNRMTLKEICCIINREDIDSNTVGSVLNIFREPGNTFIRPFITEEKESLKLDEDVVLDITHESLIRNWRFLEEWAEEEFENYTISLDFEQQLNRWVDSDKSKGFLLSIGPLTYFENWYNQAKPNPWWIARYLPEDIDRNKKLEKAERILYNTRQFVRESAKKHRITRAVMRYGTGKIAAGLAIIALVTLSSFAIRNYYRQQNSIVLEAIKEQSFSLVNSSKVNFIQKSTLLAEQLKSGAVTIDEIISHVDGPIAKINAITRLAGLLAYQGRNEPINEIKQSLKVADSLSELHFSDFDKFEKIEKPLKEINYLRIVLEFGDYYNPSSELISLKERSARRSANLVKYIIAHEPKSFNNVDDLNVALENAINYRAFTDQEINDLLFSLSPFENSKRSDWITSKYSRDNLASRGWFDYGFKYNGLYQELAYLYAAQGKSDEVFQCIDSLLKYNQNYYQNNYDAMIDNGSNIATVFYLNDHLASFDEFVKGYCIRKKVSPIEFYRRLIGRIGVSSYGSANWLEFNGVNTNLNITFANPEFIQFIFSKYRLCISETLVDANARNYYLALSWKDEALFKKLRMDMANQVPDQQSLEKLFDNAVENYNKVSSKYLNEEIIAAKFTDNDATSMPRKFIFLYPDFRTPFTPTEPRRYHFYYVSDGFVKYLLDKNLFDELYTDQDLNYFSAWIESYFADYNGLAFELRKKADSSVLIKLERKIRDRKVSVAGMNYLYLIVGNEAFNAGNSELASQFYSKIALDKVYNLVNYSEFDAKRESFNAIANAIVGLISMGQKEEAYALIKLFKNPINRSSLYAYAAKELLRKKLSNDLTGSLIDSSKMELTRIKNLATGQPNRVLIAYALAMQDPQQAAEADKMVKNLWNKLGPSLRVTRALAFHGDLYAARMNMPANLSDGDQADFLWNIYYGFQEGQGVEKTEWREFRNNYFWQQTSFIIYVNEDN